MIVYAVRRVVLTSWPVDGHLRLGLTGLCRESGPAGEERFIANDAQMLRRVMWVEFGVST